jgi:hypothetical protein
LAALPENFQATAERITGDPTYAEPFMRLTVRPKASDQAFHLEGNPELRNPSIALKQGETAELVLRNDDPNRVLHCLSIGGLDVKTPSIDSGQTFTVTLRPTKRGTLTYACLMHPPMAGKLIVQ